MAELIEPAAVWKRVTAVILDFRTIFLVGGYVIGRITGTNTENGFSLAGGPAWVLLALIVIYFFVGRATPAARCGTGFSASAGRSRTDRGSLGWRNKTWMVGTSPAVAGEKGEKLR